MSATVLAMPKTEQVRIPIELAGDARIVASALGETLPEYTARILRQAIARDFPKVAKIIAKRAEQAGREPEEDE